MNYFSEIYVDDLVTAWVISTEYTTQGLPRVECVPGSGEVPAYSGGPLNVCPNGIIESPELCDDNTLNGCNPTCSAALAGWSCTAPPGGLSVCTAIPDDGLI